MKKTLLLSLPAAGLLLLALALPSYAADGQPRTRTITGTGTCAKCDLKETDKCQNVIQTERNGQKITIYLVDNDVSKEFHKNICKGPKKITATGTIKRVDGKREMTATKIELAKDKE